MLVCVYVPGTLGARREREEAGRCHARPLFFVGLTPHKAIKEVLWQRHLIQVNSERHLQKA